MGNRRPKRKLRNLMLIIVGWVFVVLGIAGLFLPILQGVLFLLVGLTILSSVSPRARLLRQRLGARFPSVRQRLQDARAWLKSKQSHLSRRR